ncbi:MAG TPA: glycosyltransferase family 4 protein [Verrucomicrobiae bacterium]|jgi:glycosyltransferase involved in cell wall biosynthesis|nr:glycosyltransferase family 4 protein [Verrucomicrobiae bacterium]
MTSSPPAPRTVSILTGGADKPYALGLAAALMEKGVAFDFIGSDYVDGPSLHGTPLVNYLNFRGDQNPKASSLTKALRLLKYYLGLLKYAATAQPKIFHILWHNKFDVFDRTLLLLYYKALGKKLVFTAHNVNAGLRDSSNSWLNRLSLQVQYRLMDHTFVHTAKMKADLCRDFRVPESKATLIPFGINNTLPNTALTGAEARQRLGLGPSDKVILFFGNICAYKGVEYLTEAWAALAPKYPEARLIIAGRPREQDAAYWREVQAGLARGSWGARVLEKIEYISEADVEVYFKAADVLVLPYTYIFQSGVLFLGYSFGLPVLAADVGSLKEEIVEGETGHIFQPQNAADLARVLEKYFQSDLYRQLPQRRRRIQDFANERYSWAKVAALTTACYQSLL